MLLATFVSIGVGFALGHLPAGALAGMLALIPAVAVAVGARRHAEDMKALRPYLGLNVVVNLLTPVLVATGMLLS